MLKYSQYRTVKDLDKIVKYKALIVVYMRFTDLYFIVSNVILS